MSHTPYEPIPFDVMEAVHELSTRLTQHGISLARIEAGGVTGLVYQLNTACGPVLVVSIPRHPFVPDSQRTIRRRLTDGSK